MIRSFSMRAEEMVSQYRIQRISSSHEGNSTSNPEAEKRLEEISNNAIQEVDEMAENVEEQENDNDVLTPQAGDEHNLPGQV